MEANPINENLRTDGYFEVKKGKQMATIDRIEPQPQESMRHSESMSRESMGPSRESC